VVSGLFFICAFAFPLPFTSVSVQGLCMAGTDPAPSAHQAPAASDKQEGTPSVTVYVTSWCPACSMTINYLKKKQIPFTVKDIEKNRDYMKEMVQKVGGYRGVPVLDINGKTYLGFHPSIIDDLEKQ